MPADAWVMGHRYPSPSGLPSDPRWHPTEHPQGLKFNALRVILTAIPGVTNRSVLHTPFYFQVPPMDEIGYSDTFDWTDFGTLNAGTFSRPNAAGLQVVTFASMFIDYDASFTQHHERNATPLTMANNLRAIGRAETPFALTVGEPLLWGKWEIDHRPFTLRSLRVSERAGEVDARYFDVSFTEYRDLALLERGFGRGSSKSSKLPMWLAIDALGPDRATLALLGIWAYGAASGWGLIKQANPWLGKGATGSTDLPHLPPTLLRKHPKILVPARKH